MHTVRIAPQTLSVEQAVKLYDALNERGQKELITTLSCYDATMLAKHIQAAHKDELPCTCFACCYPTKSD